MEEIYDIMKNMNMDNVTYKMIESSHGHDSFLVDIDKFSDYLVDILEDRV